MRSKRSVGIFTVVAYLNVNALIEAAVFFDYGSDAVGNIGCENIGICGIELIYFHLVADGSDFPSVGL